jgi:hypothetical protein
VRGGAIGGGPLSAATLLMRGLHGPVESLAGVVVFDLRLASFHGDGQVNNVMCLAHRKTDALLKPVTNPPSAPRMAHMVTMKVMSF